MSRVKFEFDPADQFFGTAAFVCCFGTCLFGLLTPPAVRASPVPKPVVLVKATPACDVHDWGCLLGDLAGRAGR